MKIMFFQSSAAVKKILRCFRCDHFQLLTLIWIIPSAIFIATLQFMNQWICPKKIRSSWCMMLFLIKMYTYDLIVLIPVIIVFHPINFKCFERIKQFFFSPSASILRTGTSPYVTWYINLRMKYMCKTKSRVFIPKTGIFLWLQFIHQPSSQAFINLSL